MEVPSDLPNRIADSLEAHQQCFIHKRTLEIISYPEEYLLDLDPGQNVWQEDIEKVESDPNYIQIEAMPSNDLFDVMEEFANSVSDRSVKTRLLNALNGRKPFAHFKYQIENTAHFRDLWFECRRAKNIEWVTTQINGILTENKP
ncbi:MAG TPA: UPF0158 family protein [Chitinophagaceae bacterium]|nr:UPF0158 family protein [Chitinophagaceae bacterium]